VNAKDVSGANALMAASKLGHAEVVKQLIEAKAAVNERSRSGMTALCYAVTEGHLEIIRQLVDHGADVNAKCQDDLTPLAMAKIGNLEKVIDFLKTKGAR
jgi:hypothetical protein